MSALDELARTPDDGPLTGGTSRPAPPDAAKPVVVSRRRSLMCGLAFGASGTWGLAIGVGLVFALWYEFTPKPTAVAPAAWPVETQCRLAADRPTLLMFVHPRCPCSRSSISELDVLMARCQGRLDARVLFYQPTSSPDDWARTDLWESAARIPGVDPQIDLGGTEHRRFGARVSGEVYVYQPNGELSFHGGITAGRGHAGDNDGRLAIESLVLHGNAAMRVTPAFGCQLDNNTACEKEALAARQPRPGNEP